jgi:hypothetical protein
MDKDAKAMDGNELLAVLLLGSFAAQAQNVYGVITGRVLDPSGAVVPNASVVAVNTGTAARFPVTSSSDGLFHAAGAPGGRV